MRNELHRNQVTNTQPICENLRDAAYHEAGHVVVAQLKLRKMGVAAQILVLQSTYRWSIR